MYIPLEERNGGTVNWNEWMSKYRRRPLFFLKGRRNGDDALSTAAEILYPLSVMDTDSHTPTLLMYWAVLFQVHKCVMKETDSL